MSGLAEHWCIWVKTLLRGGSVREDLDPEYDADLTTDDNGEYVPQSISEIYRRVTDGKDSVK